MNENTSTDKANNDSTQEFGINHPLAVKLWSNKLFKDANKESMAMAFMTKASDGLMTLKTEAMKGKGDAISFGLRARLTQKGILGDETLVGNEEKISTYHDRIILDQLRHAVRSDGAMSDQRVPFNVREEARLGLLDWWADRVDTAFFNQLCGNVVAKDVRFTGNQKVEQVDEGHILRPKGHKGDHLLKSSDGFSLDLVDAIVEKAKVMDNPIRPIRFGHSHKYVMFLHPYQVSALRQDARWNAIQQALLSGGFIQNNPLFTGAVGEYNNVIFIETPHVSLGVNADGTKNVEDTRRAVFCGAQAAVFALGQRHVHLNAEGLDMSWHEESFDYDNQLGVSSGMIFGLKATSFNDKRFGSIVVPTYASSKK